MYSILIIDKELKISESLRIQLRERNVQLLHVDSVEDFFEQIGQRSYDLILLEIPGSDDVCLDSIARIKKVSPRSEIIMLAHERQIKESIASLKAGADDVYVKPLNFSRLLKKLDKMRSEDKISSDLSRRPDEEPRTFSHLASRNIQFQKTLDELEDVAVTNANIHLTGERGTGKSVLARVIHNTSNRRDFGFIQINCRTISAPDFELATGGTLFLNEISDLDLNLQSGLLDAIDQNNIQHAGGSKEITPKTRIISTSTTDMETLITTGKFREDLFFRLNAAEYEIPPLRERREDIVSLLLRFMDEFNIRLMLSVERITPLAGEFLRNYDWPENIPQLRSLCESMMVKMKGNTIDLEHIPEEIRIRKLDAFKSLQEIQKEHIITTLDALKGNKSRTAKVLGISRTTLISKVKQYKEE